MYDFVCERKISCELLTILDFLHQSYTFQGNESLIHLLASRKYCCSVALKILLETKWNMIIVFLQVVWTSPPPKSQNVYIPVIWQDTHKDKFSIPLQADIVINLGKTDFARLAIILWVETILFFCLQKYTQTTFNLRH